MSKALLSVFVLLTGASYSFAEEAVQPQANQTIRSEIKATEQTNLLAEMMIFKDQDGKATLCASGACTVDAQCPSHCMCGAMGVCQ